MFWGKRARNYNRNRNGGIIRDEFFDYDYDYEQEHDYLPECLPTFRGVSWLYTTVSSSVAELYCQLPHVTAAHAIRCL